MQCLMIVYILSYLIIQYVTHRKLFRHPTKYCNGSFHKTCCWQDMLLARLGAELPLGGLRQSRLTQTQ